MPATKGTTMRFSRCTANARDPRLRHSMAVKKPLSMKNKGILKP